MQEFGVTSIHHVNAEYIVKKNQADPMSILVNACASSTPISPSLATTIDYGCTVKSNNAVSNKAGDNTEFKAVIYAHPLLGHRQAYDTKVWEAFDPADNISCAVWGHMWGGRHNHFKLDICNAKPMSNVYLELCWRPVKHGNIELFPDQEVLRIGCQKSDGDVRDGVWHDDLEHLGTKAPKIWVQTIEKQLKVDEAGNLRVRLRINRKSEYDVETRYRKEYIIKVTWRDPVEGEGYQSTYSSPILVPAKGMKKGNLGPGGVGSIKKESSATIDDDDDDFESIEGDAASKVAPKRKWNEHACEVELIAYGDSMNINHKKSKVITNRSDEDFDETIWCGQRSPSSPVHMISSIITPAGDVALDGGLVSSSLIDLPVVNTVSIDEMRAELDSLRSVIRNQANDLIMRQLDLSRRYEIEQRQLQVQWKKLFESMCDGYTKHCS